ncbi:MAG: rhodanese-like domain-containing protein [Nitrosopumilus sp.]|nr:rhodanese-like domain-containing protein [Nitrosopumilus sp.]MDH3489873.1 rhodanese-like domain-containing protein [Nitrosopumilus sp.]MDH3516696.1 rhodanese-like domain-containing protein [Nitrosopumilus sp.]MDH3564705.1 rhodanese-like domain-containing protein [Nitrosopumilus sp.]MDH5417451.1 rhodanese-like domain-containing protein [Nitrosopumilus sp.]
MLVSTDWLRENISNPNLIVLDTRPKTMFLYGHLQNAQSLSVDKVIQFDKFGSNLVIELEKIVELFNGLGIDENKTVVLVGDPMDPSAARIAWSLLYFGHAKTFLLDANASDLQKYGFKLTKQISSVTPTSFTPKINSEIRIESEFLKDNLNNFEILDARSPQEFMGGHLPNSKLVPFTDGLGFDGKLFRDPESLKTMFSENKISKNKEIVCYCMHGHRASSLFLQLKIAGFDKVKLYDGSFVEWHGKQFPLE